jgi:uncharacterized protein YdhG (YjbR/CyaY superfamily)
MNTQNNTESIRISKALLDDIKKIIPLTGQTVKGYVEIHLKKQVDKDLLKMLKEAIILAKKEINAKESNT